ncbi:MAG TPA: CBS domain-containing protein [Smithella sp.]|nr:CBS domain-containing protein [Smithella sp.]
MEINNNAKSANQTGKESKYRFIYFSELIKLPVCVGKIKNRIGKLTDIVFSVKDQYPEAVGIYLEYGWGKPTAFIPWAKVIKIEDDAIFVQPPEDGTDYPPFIDQAGWILLDKHLMGRTIVDIDDRRVEVVNDIHLLEVKSKLVIIHVDISFNGFLRRWGLGRFHMIKDDFISWKYVQPLSVEDAISTDKLALSITRKDMMELPSEDLADILEELPGDEQQALFSALDSEKAAETLAEAEPRAQRQIIANLRKERASNIFSEMSIPQLAGLFAILPHDQVTQFMQLLGKEQYERVNDILSKREATANSIMSTEFIATPKEVRVGEVIGKIRKSGLDPHSLSYIYIVNEGDNKLLGVADLRELLLTDDDIVIDAVMASPVITAEEDDVQEDLAEIFAKYHYEMIPVVDRRDRLLGVIHYNDIMKGIETRGKI